MIGTLTQRDTTHMVDILATWDQPVAAPATPSPATPWRSARGVEPDCQAREHKRVSAAGADLDCYAATLAAAGPPRWSGRYAGRRVPGGLIAVVCAALVSAAFTTPPVVVAAQSFDAKTLVLPPTELEPGWEVGTASGDASAYDAQYFNVRAVQMAQFGVVLQPNSDLARQVVPGLVPPQQKDASCRLTR